MRKLKIEPDGQRPAEAAAWLDLTTIATVEITSEDELFPIEHALAPGAGWRAASPGPQVIRLLFDSPVELHRIGLHIVERAAERSQEFAVYVEMAGMGRQEVWRQQFHFSPHGSTEELEDHAVELAHVTVFELRIDPDRAHDPATSIHYASLLSLRLA